MKQQDGIQLGRLIPWLSWPFQELIAVKVIGGKCKQKIAVHCYKLRNRYLGQNIHESKSFLSNKNFSLLANGIYEIMKS